MSAGVGVSWGWQIYNGHAKNLNVNQCKCFQAASLTFMQNKTKRDMKERTSWEWLKFVRGFCIGGEKSKTPHWIVLPITTLQNILCTLSNATHIEEFTGHKNAAFSDFKARNLKGNFEKSVITNTKALSDNTLIGCWVSQGHFKLVCCQIWVKHSRFGFSTNCSSSVHCQEFYFILCRKISSFSCEWACRAKHQIVCSCCATLRPVYMFHSVTFWTAVYKDWLWVKNYYSWNHSFGSGVVVLVFVWGDRNILKLLNGKTCCFMMSWV